MKKMIQYIMLMGLLAGCQHQLHFPETPVVIIPHEKTVAAIVVTNPTEVDYDSVVFRYHADRTQEVHYNAKRTDSVIRTYYYDAAGRLSLLEDQKAIYYTNNNKAKRISFLYDGNGQLQQTKTDFEGVPNVTAYANYNNAGGNRQFILYDTSYSTALYKLDWVNRVIYNTVSSSYYLLYDSAIYINTTTAGLVKTIVNAYSYAADSSVTAINSRIYFNNQLSEYGTATVSSDRIAPVYRSLRKKLFRNLSNWFETGSAWQNDNYRFFPLPGGPYKSILYEGHSLSGGAASPAYNRDYKFNNSYNGDQLDRSQVDYALSGQGSSKYTTILRYYYKD